MMSLMKALVLVNLLMMALTTLLNLISKKAISDREKSSPFECGFEPKTSARLPFSLHFFLIAIIFLIFDIEIALLIPFVISLKISNIYSISMTMITFLIILLMGLYHEWNQGALNWAK